MKVFSLLSLSSVSFANSFMDQAQRAAGSSANTGDPFMDQAQSAAARNSRNAGQPDPATPGKSSSTITTTVTRYVDSSQYPEFYEKCDQYCNYSSGVDKETTGRNVERPRPRINLSDGSYPFCRFSPGHKTAECRVRLAQQVLWPKFIGGFKTHPIGSCVRFRSKWNRDERLARPLYFFATDMEEIKCENLSKL